MLLPPRPLRLQPLFVLQYAVGGAALAVFGAAALIVGAALLYGSACELSEESRIWESGVTAPEASAKGKVRTKKFLFHDCKIDVTYADEAGGTHRGSVDFDTLVGSFDDSAPPVVRYLPEDPKRFAVSWAVDARASRIAHIVFLTLGGGVGTIAFAIVGIGMLRRLSLARRCALESDELVVRITKVEPRTGRFGGHAGNEYHYAGPAPYGGDVSGEESLGKGEEPLFADASKTTIVVLVDPAQTGHALVVRGDFHPFVLTPEEQETVRAAIKPR
jgi:hypothetical protein